MFPPSQFRFAGSVLRREYDRVPCLHFHFGPLISPGEKPVIFPPSLSSAELRLFCDAPREILSLSFWLVPFLRPYTRLVPNVCSFFLFKKALWPHHSRTHLLGRSVSKRVNSPPPLVSPVKRRGVSPLTVFSALIYKLFRHSTRRRGCRGVRS